VQRLVYCSKDMWWTWCLICSKHWRLWLVEVHQAKVPTATTGSFIARQDLSAFENNTYEPTCITQPFLFVKTNKTWRCCIYCMIATHLDLREDNNKKNRVSNNNDNIRVVLDETRFLFDAR